MNDSYHLFIDRKTINSENYVKLLGMSNDVNSPFEDHIFHFT